MRWRALSRFETWRSVAILWANQAITPPLSVGLSVPVSLLSAQPCSCPKISQRPLFVSLNMSDMDRGRRGAIASPSEAEGKVRPHRMVNIEMEAAEALADLAQLAVRGSGSGSGGEVAGRAGKRVETESPLSDSQVDSVPSCPDLAQVRILPFLFRHSVRL